MKKHTILKLFLGFASIMSITACRDAVDIVQEGELKNENVYQSTSDLKRILDGDVYTGLSITNQISFTSFFTDEIGIGPANSSFGTGPHQFYVDITTPEAGGIWMSNYYIINRVVRFLKGAATIKPSTADLKSYNSYLAEARALRAFSYLQLLSYYSTDISNPNALGVILLDHVPDFSEQLSRSNNSVIYSEIESDLNFAENNIDATTERNQSRYYVSKSLIYAIKARYYLYTKQYALAKQYASKVITESGLALTLAKPVPTVAGESNYGNAWHRGLNALSTTNPYVRMLQDTDRGEVIFSLSRPSVGAWENIAGLFSSNTTNAVGAVYDMGRNLFNSLDSYNGDIRKYAYVDPSLKLNPNYLTSPDYRKDDVLPIDKYPGKSGQPLRNDVKVFRLSEMYFILAECAVAENNLSAAAGYIKNVRDARNYKGETTLPQYTTTKDALVDILKERRVELCFEGHRYLDLKRLGIASGTAIDRSIVDDFTKDAPVTIPMDDYRFTLPIPRNELQANQVIQQNPGYKTTP